MDISGMVGWIMTGERVQKKRFRKIYVEITNSCNLACSFCSPVTRPVRSMSTEEFAHIAGQVSTLTDLVFLHVKGEPLLHPGLETILGICTEHSVMVNLTTNGTLLSRTAGILLGSPALRQVNISLHTHDSRRQQQHLEDIWSFIRKNTSREKPCYISLRLWNYTRTGENTDNSRILQAVEAEFGQSMDEKKLLSHQGIKLNRTTYINADEVFTWPDMNLPLRQGGLFCPGLRDQIAILADGTVVPCCLDSNGVIGLGNIFTQSLEDIIATERSQAILEGFSQNQSVEELCKRCNRR